MHFPHGSGAPLLHDLRWGGGVLAEGRRATLGTSVHYENAVDSRRAAWRVITSVEQKEKFKGKEQLDSHARENIAKVEGELQKIREGILALMDKNLVSSACAGELQVFYYKMKGDYNRDFAGRGKEQSF